MYDYVEKKEQNRNSCGGCMILASVVLLFFAACLSMCSESPAAIKDRQEKEVARFIASKNLELDRKAASALTQKEFRCYAQKLDAVLVPAVTERRNVLDAGTITLDQFKAHVSAIYESKGDKIFLECVNETK